MIAAMFGIHPIGRREAVNFPVSNDPCPRISLADNTPLPAPLVIYVEPTNLCMYKCDWCPVSLPNYRETVGEKKHMEVELYARLMDEIREWKGVKVIRPFYFGESLLHPQIGELLRLSTRALDRVEFTTTALPMTEKHAQEIIDAGVHYLRVSLYPTQPHWLKIRDNVKRLREMRDSQGKSKPFICVKVFTADEMPVAKLAYDGIADDFWTEGFHSMGSDCIPLLPSKSEKIACPFPFYMLIVKVNGDVVPCPVAWEKSLTMGNVHRNTLKEIWNGPDWEKLRTDHLAGERKKYAACKDCDTLHCCNDSVEGLTQIEYQSRRG